MGSWGAVEGVVEFPDGLRVRGTGLCRPRGGVPDPDVALYLLDCDPLIEEWPYRWVRWPDFGLPASTEEVVAALREVRERAGSERVEIACAGGIGRTGTALSLLAVMSGVPPEGAVAWVRSHYRPDAVETDPQRLWIADVAAALPS